MESTGLAVTVTVAVAVLESTPFVAVNV
jgi:hypothetical protein